MSAQTFALLYLSCIMEVQLVIHQPVINLFLILKYLNTLKSVYAIEEQGTSLIYFTLFYRDICNFNSRKS